jgi:hypothetical protein
MIPIRTSEPSKSPNVTSLSAAYNKIKAVLMDRQGIQTSRARQPKLTLSGAVRTNAVLVGTNADIVEATKAQMSNTSFMVSKKSDDAEEDGCKSVCWHAIFLAGTRKILERKRFSRILRLKRGVLKLPPMTA